MHIGIIVGSHRQDSQSAKVGRFLATALEHRDGVSTWTLDLGKTPLPLWDEALWSQGEQWSELPALKTQLDSSDIHMQSQSESSSSASVSVTRAISSAEISAGRNDHHVRRIRCRICFTTAVSLVDALLRTTPTAVPGSLGCKAAWSKSWHDPTSLARCEDRLRDQEGELHTNGVTRAEKGAL